MTELARLLDVADIDAVSVDPRTLAPDTPYVGLEHLATGGGITAYSSVGASVLASNKFKFDSRHVLLGKLRPNLRKVGRPDLAGVCSTDIYPLRPREHVDGNYLGHFLLLPRVGRWLAERATGANLPRISSSTLSSLEVPLPQLEEQRRIAAILDQADELRAKRRRTLAQIQDLRASALDSFLAEHPSSPAFFGSFIDDLRYGTSVKSSDHGMPILRIPNVARGRVDLREVKRVPVDSGEAAKVTLVDGDILLVRSNGNPEMVGRAAMFTNDLLEGSPWQDEEFGFASYLIRARLSGDMDPRFVTALLESTPLRRQIRRLAKTSAGQYNLNGPAIRSLRMPRPQLEEQRQFVRNLEAIDAMESKAEAHLAALDELFASLQHRAFTGQL